MKVVYGSSLLRSTVITLPTVAQHIVPGNASCFPYPRVHQFMILIFSPLQSNIPTHSSISLLLLNIVCVGLQKLTQSLELLWMDSNLGALSHQVYLCACAIVWNFNARTYLSLTYTQNETTQTKPFSGRAVALFCGASRPSEYIRTLFLCSLKRFCFAFCFAICTTMGCS